MTTILTLIGVVFIVFSIIGFEVWCKGGEERGKQFFKAMVIAIWGLIGFFFVSWLLALLFMGGFNIIEWLFNKFNVPIWLFIFVLPIVFVFLLGIIRKKMEKRSRTK